MNAFLCGSSSPDSMALWICMAFAFVIFATLIGSTASFRSPADRPAASLARNRVVEVLWSVVPIAIICMAALPTVQTVQDQQCAAQATSEDRIESSARSERALIVAQER